MTRHGVILMALAIIAIAGWAYSINYNTLTRLDRVSALRAQIAAERESLQVLRVEWAYLNNPDRLTRLVADHNQTLGLVPLMPEALSHVAAVPFAEDDEQPILGQVSGRRGVPVPRTRPASWSDQ